MLGDGFGAADDDGVAVVALHAALGGVDGAAAFAEPGEGVVEVVLDDGSRRRRWGDAGELVAAVGANQLRLAGIPLALAAAFGADVSFEGTHLRGHAAVARKRRRHALARDFERRTGFVFAEVAVIREEWWLLGHSH